ncbi:MAG: response regulator [Candidatus Omnitrophica bacterium]|nr:response regulator [Candidatus Omnitrophota bacterium]
MAKTILLVDDEDQTRGLLKKALERRGNQIYDTGKGYEAVELYKQHKPNGVFLDVKLPDLEGPEVLQKIKEFDPQAKVYFITGVSQAEYQLGQKSKEMGAAGYLSKPVIMEDLLEIVDSF